MGWEEMWLLSGVLLDDNSAEEEAPLQLRDIVTLTNLYKLKMAFRLELRKCVVSCQISEQVEHETE